MRTLIIGGTSEVAKELAIHFVKQGHEVILAARDCSRLEPLRKDVSLRYGRELKLVEVDVSQKEDLLRLYRWSSVNHVVCLLGYLGEQKLAERKENEMEKIIDLNYRIPALILRHFAQVFEQRGSGTIIGFSSVAGERGRASNYCYGSAKAAFTTFLDGLRNRLASSGVHVMTVKPGFMDTKMTAHLELPKLLTSSPRQAANCVIRGMEKQRNEVFVSPVWRYVMWVIGLIPEPIFKRMSL